VTVGRALGVTSARRKAATHLYQHLGFERQINVSHGHLPPDSAIT
jgi:hypothetical protein